MFYFFSCLFTCCISATVLHCCFWWHSCPLSCVQYSWLTPDTYTHRSDSGFTFNASLHCPQVVAVKRQTYPRVLGHKQTIQESIWPCKTINTAIMLCSAWRSGFKPKLCVERTPKLALVFKNDTQAVSCGGRQLTHWDRGGNWAT
jgi:hypothetical protein